MDNRTSLLRRIQAYDFAIVEMNLFLDTHPTDAQGIALFHMYQEKRNQLIAAYETQYGPYINTVNDVKGNNFTWISDPWPWEFCKEM